VPLLLRRSHGGHQNEKNDEKKPGHVICFHPAMNESPRLLSRFRAKASPEPGHGRCCRNEKRLRRIDAGAFGENEAEEITARRPCGPAQRDRGRAPCGNRWRDWRAA
jgi:hypothetical protein